MRSHLRRLGPIALAVVIAVALVPATAASDYDTSSAAVAAAEREALRLTNLRRTSRGLLKLRLDSRLTELARERARYMADTGRFSHLQANGTDVFDMIASSGIRWYAAGEIIAWNTAGPLDYSADFAVKGWMGSPSHRAIVLSDDYNYVGFGLAIAEDGTRYWAGVYLRGPDRTGGYVRMGGFRTEPITSRIVRGTVTWSGRDLLLQVLTAGHRDFQVQWRRVGYAWNNLGSTTARKLTKWWRRGLTYEVRVRERDRNGNRGPWVVKTLKP
jgi:uncharacterized protein YkwD